MKNLNLLKSAFASLSVLLLLISAPLTQVKAVDTPSFPACTNPQGTIKSDYPAGTHGIVGEGGQFLGSDRVYTLSPNTLQQCFCSASGDGIQTNWWKISSLTEDQIEVLKRDGWILVPNGSLWGLEEAPYLAKNTNYSCNNNNNGGNQGGSSSSAGGEVLGVAINLPKTGADALWLIIASVLLISGLVLLFQGKLRKRV